MSHTLLPLKAGKRSSSLESNHASRDGTPRKEVPPVKPWHCQAALATIQFAFCLGSVYLKSSLRNIDLSSNVQFHPIIYAFMREAVAGPIMCLIAYLQTGSLPKKQDLPVVVGLGLCLWLNQLLYILGIDMSGVVVATCMQPVIPVFTAMIAVALKLEAGSLQKFAGIGIAVGGSLCMVMGGVSGGGHHTAAEGHIMMLGNICLLINTLASAVYYLGAKRLVQSYSAMCVAAWAYITAATCMGLTAGLFVDRKDWKLPDALIGPLIYWILVCSVVGYYVVTFATQHLPASQVASFQCLQPFVGTLLAFAVLGEEPSVWDLGAVGVVAGLVMVAYDRKDLPAHPFISRMKKAFSLKDLAGKERREILGRDKRSQVEAI